MTKKDNNIPLRLSDEHFAKLEAIKENFTRPSRNNTIEFIIDMVFKDHKLKLPK